MRVARMRLGDEVIELTEYLAPRGRPIPVDSRATIDGSNTSPSSSATWTKPTSSFARTKLSTPPPGPRRFPTGTKPPPAFALFISRIPTVTIWRSSIFPRTKGPEAGNNANGELFLGIDHTAIVVSDTAQSLKFYRDLLGLKLVGESMNHGTEQEHLNNVSGARLRISGLRAEAAPE